MEPNCQILCINRLFRPSHDFTEGKTYSAHVDELTKVEAINNYGEQHGLGHLRGDDFFGKHFVIVSKDF